MAWHGQMRRSFQRWPWLLGILLAVLPGKVGIQADPTDFHLIMINEIYTNSDGTRQFIELIALAEGQTNLPPTHVESHNADATDTTLVFDFTTTFPQLNNGETILLATQTVEDELGFNVDRIIAPNSITFVNGRVLFDRDVGMPVDAVAYGSYTGDNSGFGTPAPSIPANGTQSLQRIRYSFVTPNNSTDFQYAVNSPKRNDGITGTLQGDPLPPVLAPIGAKATDEGVLLGFGVSASDPNGTFPSLVAQGLPSGANFVNNLNGTGTFSWTPGYLQAGNYDVLFIASDADSADSELVSITVNEVTDPPSAYDSLAFGQEDTPFAAQLQGSDPDQDPLVYQVLSGPFRGVISDFDSLTGSFTYSPNLNVSGSDSLTFRVRDNYVYSGSAKWRVTINPVNDRPVAGDVQGSTIKNMSIPIGSMPVSDVDHSSCTVAHIGGPFNGTVSGFVATSGSFQYNPDLDYFGPDSILYSATDPAGGADTALVRIQVYDECGCPCPADPACDSIRSDILDVSTTINVAFRGVAPTSDPGCARERTDVDCSGSTDIIDVSKVIGVAFRGQAAGTEYCSPCAP